MKPTELGLLRIAALGLAGPPAATAAGAVRTLLCLQGQDLPGALLAVALRTQGRSLAEVREALAAGEVVRTWTMRGTLHLVAAEDVGLLLGLTGARQHAQAAARRRGLGLTDEVVARAAAIAAEALAERPRTRAELHGLWGATGSHAAHLVSHLAQAGHFVLGPMREKEQLVVPMPTTRRREQDEALAELALRYFTAHGPATAADLARWAGLPLGQVRTGIVAVRDHLEAIGEQLMAPGTPERLEQARAQAAGTHLLPGFDELVLGYADRTCTLPAEHADRIVPGGNGVFRATVVHRGQVVATWRRKGKALETEALTPPLPAIVQRGAERAFVALPAG